MILTGNEILNEVRAGRLVIDPFDPERVEPNSYGFKLASTVIEYQAHTLDPHVEAATVRKEILRDGLLLQPDRSYLCATSERMGSDTYAATLFANRSVSTMGVWIQASAPLGHAGAIIPWTLEILVAHPTMIYAGMLIGKIAFWRPQGEIIGYKGKYSGSRSAVESRFMEESA